MGLVDFEAQGSQEPQVVLDVHRGRLTTRQRRKAQTLILAAPTKGEIEIIELKTRLEKVRME